MPVPLRPRAGIMQSFVQPERFVCPEFDLDRADAVASPIRWARHLAEVEPGGLERDRLFQRETAFERARLLAGPGPDAAIAVTAGEIEIKSGSTAATLSAGQFSLIPASLKQTEILAKSDAALLRVEAN